MRKTDFKIIPNMRNIVCLNWKFWFKCKMTFSILLLLPNRVVLHFRQEIIFQRVFKLEGKWQILKSEYD